MNKHFKRINDWYGSAPRWQLVASGLLLGVILGWAW